MTDERKTTETEIARWLEDLADHADSPHDHDMLCNLASMVENEEYRSFIASSRYQAFGTGKTPPELAGEGGKDGEQ
jgi:hypothetical protein